MSAGYYQPDDPIEPIIEECEGGPFMCEDEDCNLPAVVELSWPMEDHDFPSGFFCQKHLDEALNG